MGPAAWSGKITLLTRGRLADKGYSGNFRDGKAIREAETRDFFFFAGCEDCRGQSSTMRMEASFYFQFFLGGRSLD